MGMVDDYRRKLEANRTGGGQMPAPGIGTGPGVGGVPQIVEGAQPVQQPSPQVPLPPVSHGGYGSPVGAPSPVPMPGPQVPMPPVSHGGYGTPEGSPAPVPMPGPQVPMPPPDSGHGGFRWGTPTPVPMPSPHLNFPQRDHGLPRFGGLPAPYAAPAALDFSTIPTQMAQQLAQRSSPIFQGRF